MRRIEIPKRNKLNVWKLKCVRNVPQSHEYVDWNRRNKQNKTKKNVHSKWSSISSENVGKTITIHIYVEFENENML